MAESAPAAAPVGGASVVGKRVKIPGKGPKKEYLTGVVQAYPAGHKLAAERGTPYVLDLGDGQQEHGTFSADFTKWQPIDVREIETGKRPPGKPRKAVDVQWLEGAPQQAALASPDAAAEPAGGSARSGRKSTRRRSGSLPPEQPDAEQQGAAAGPSRAPNAAATTSSAPTPADTAVKSEAAADHKAPIQAQPKPEAPQGPGSGGQAALMRSAGLMTKKEEPAGADPSATLGKRAGGDSTKQEAQGDPPPKRGKLTHPARVVKEGPSRQVQMIGGAPDGPGPSGARAGAGGRASVPRAGSAEAAKPARRSEPKTYTGPAQPTTHGRAVTRHAAALVPIDIDIEMADRSLSDAEVVFPQSHRSTPGSPLAPRIEAPDSPIAGLTDPDKRAAAGAAGAHGPSLSPAAPRLSDPSPIAFTTSPAGASPVYAPAGASTKAADPAADAAAAAVASWDNSIAQAALLLNAGLPAEVVAAAGGPFAQRAGGERSASRASLSSPDFLDAPGSHGPEPAARASSAPQAPGAQLSSQSSASPFQDLVKHLSRRQSDIAAAIVGAGVGTPGNHAGMGANPTSTTLGDGVKKTRLAAAPPTVRDPRGSGAAAGGGGEAMVVGAPVRARGGFHLSQKDEKLKAFESAVKGLTITKTQISEASLLAVEAAQSAGGFAPVIRVVVNRSETLAGAAKQAEDAATAAQCKSKRLALVYLLDNVIQRVMSRDNKAEDNKAPESCVPKDLPSKMAQGLRVILPGCLPNDDTGVKKAQKLLSMVDRWASHGWMPEGEARMVREAVDGEAKRVAEAAGPQARGGPGEPTGRGGHRGQPHRIVMALAPDPPRYPVLEVWKPSDVQGLDHDPRARNLLGPVCASFDVHMYGSFGLPHLHTDNNPQLFSQIGEEIVNRPILARFKEDIEGKDGEDIFAEDETDRELFGNAVPWKSYCMAMGVGMEIETDEQGVRMDPEQKTGAMAAGMAGAGMMSLLPPHMMQDQQMLMAMQGMAPGLLASMALGNMAMGVGGLNPAMGMVNAAMGMGVGMGMAGGMVGAPQTLMAGVGGGLLTGVQQPKPPPMPPPGGPLLQPQQPAVPSLSSDQLLPGSRNASASQRPSLPGAKGSPVSGLCNISAQPDTAVLDTTVPEELMVPDKGAFTADGLEGDNSDDRGYISPPRAPQRDNSERLHDEDMDLSDDTPTSMYEEPPYDDGPMQTEPQPPHDDYPGYHGAPPPLPPPPPLHGAHGALPPWHQHSAPPLPQDEAPPPPPPPTHDDHPPLPHEPPPLPFDPPLPPHEPPPLPPHRRPQSQTHKEPAPGKATQKQSAAGARTPQDQHPLEGGRDQQGAGVKATVKPTQASHKVSLTAGLQSQQQPAARRAASDGLPPLLPGAQPARVSSGGGGSGGNTPHIVLFAAEMKSAAGNRGSEDLPTKTAAFVAKSYISLLPPSQADAPTAAGSSAAADKQQPPGSTQQPLLPAGKAAAAAATPAGSLLDGTKADTKTRDARAKSVEVPDKPADAAEQRGKKHKQPSPAEPAQPAVKAEADKPKRPRIQGPTEPARTSSKGLPEPPRASSKELQRTSSKGNVGISRSSPQIDLPEPPVSAPSAPKSLADSPSPLPEPPRSGPRAPLYTGGSPHGDLQGSDGEYDRGRAQDRGGSRSRRASRERGRRDGSPPPRDRSHDRERDRDRDGRGPGHHAGDERGGQKRAFKSVSSPPRRGNDSRERDYPPARDRAPLSMERQDSRGRNLRDRLPAIQVKKDPHDRHHDDARDRRDDRTLPPPPPPHSHGGRDDDRSRQDRQGRFQGPPDRDEWRRGGRGGGRGGGRSGGRYDHDGGRSHGSQGAWGDDRGLYEGEEEEGELPSPKSHGPGRGPRRNSGGYHHQSGQHAPYSQQDRGSGGSRSGPGEGHWRGGAAPRGGAGGRGVGRRNSGPSSPPQERASSPPPPAEKPAPGAEKPKSILERLKGGAAAEAARPAAEVARMGRMG